MVTLSVPNEEKLQSVAERIEDRGFNVIRFHEPDLDDQLTAITIEPHPNVRRLLSRLPLALRGLSPNGSCSCGNGVSHLNYSEAA